jgi:hypothetical protein
VFRRSRGESSGCRPRVQLPKIRRRQAGESHELGRRAACAHGDPSWPPRRLRAAGDPRDGSRGEGRGAPMTDMRKEGELNGSMRGGAAPAAGWEGRGGAGGERESDGSEGMHLQVLCWRGYILPCGGGYCTQGRTHFCHSHLHRIVGFSMSMYQGELVVELWRLAGE